MTPEGPFVKCVFIRIRIIFNIACPFQVFLHTFYTNKRKLLYILIYIFCHFLPGSVGCEGADSPG